MPQRVRLSLLVIILYMKTEINWFLQIFLPIRRSGGFHIRPPFPGASCEGVGADAHIGPRTGEDTCPYDALSDPVRYTRGVVNAAPYEVYSDPGMNTGASHASPSEGAVSRQAD